MSPKTLEAMKSYLEAIANELNDLAAFDQMEMYRYLTRLGDDLLAKDQPEHTEENFVPGCTSNVYIAADLVDGAVRYRGSSEALVVRGYVAILTEALSGLKAQDIVNGTESSIVAFSDSTNIRASLTPSRANAFGNIYRMMRRQAQALMGRSG